jgi:hypothetical protein
VTLYLHRCYASDVLTRRELEGELRTVHPARYEAQRRRAALGRRRRYVRMALIASVGMMIVVVLAVAWPARHHRGGSARQTASWGVEHVSGYRSAAKTKLRSIFPKRYKRHQTKKAGGRYAP